MTRNGDWEAVREALRAGTREGVFSAAVLWVGLEGREAFHEATGHLGADPGEPAAHTGTVFDLASLTKPLATVTSLMRLVEDGRLSPSDPVCGHLPAFADGPDGPRRRQVTLAHLLSHASGLPAWRPYYETARHLEAARPGFLGGAAAREWVLDQVCGEKLEHPPGERAVYSDLGFILLGEVVARVAEAPLEDAFARLVAEPLGLGRTRFNPGNRLPAPFGPDVAATAEVAWRGGLLRGVVHDDNAYTMGGVAGHAGLFGTANDVGRWARGLLDAYHGRAAWLRRAVAARFLRPPDRVAGSGWVLGFDTPTPPSSTGRAMGPGSVGHLGFTGTSVWIDLEREWVVVLLTNRVHTDPTGEGIRRLRPRVHEAVARVLFGDPPAGPRGGPSGGSTPAPGGCSAPDGTGGRPAGP